MVAFLFSESQCEVVGVESLRVTESVAPPSFSPEVKDMLQQNKSEEVWNAAVREEISIYGLLV